LEINKKAAGLKLRTEVRLIIAAKSLKYSARLSMIIFNAGMVTTLQTRHLVTLYKSSIKVNQFLVSSSFTSTIVTTF
jgi:hypothetical protein